MLDERIALVVMASVPALLCIVVAGLRLGFGSDARGMGLCVLVELTGCHQALALEHATNLFKRGRDPTSGKAKLA